MKSVILEELDKLSNQELKELILPYIDKRKKEGSSSENNIREIVKEELKSFEESNDRKMLSLLRLRDIKHSENLNYLLSIINEEIIKKLNTLRELKKQEILNLPLIEIKK